MCDSVVLLPVGTEVALQENDRSHAEDRDGVLLDYHFFYVLRRVLREDSRRRTGGHHHPVRLRAVGGRGEINSSQSSRRPPRHRRDACSMGWHPTHWLMSAQVDRDALVHDILHPLRAGLGLHVLLPGAARLLQEARY